jgi:hypothetical protein
VFHHQGHITYISSTVLILSMHTCAQDSVLAVDCRDFSDPQRHKDKEERRRRGEENHIGYHHTVFAGLLRGGALVYNKRTREKEHWALTEWWEHFFLQPFWNKVLNFIEKLKEWKKKRVSDRGVKPRLYVVFFCNWGRHRSVAMQKIFLFICQYLKWARLAEASHLSSHSWKWVTCDCCEVLIAFCCI